MHHLIRTLFALNLALLPAVPSAAHEFWIEPLEFAVGPDDTLEARLRVGQEFDGVSMSYLSRNFTRFELAFGADITPVEGRLGQNPALSVEDHGQGLAVVLYETTDNTLTYDEWDRFLRFAAHKDFPDIEARHLGRGLPMTGFTESYSRHAKSLIAVGDGAGEDREYGLRTEFVALANPYTDDLSGGFPVQLFLDGEPRADAQVELFDRDADGEVTITLHRTDADGRAVLPVTPGHAYLADAVTLQEVTPNDNSNAVWHTLWASLTFEVPAQ
ncbi:DUF4198 domain-containing protein [Nioella aestuarii]|uniref:DUF4198 domain-containing protein n=1 Tax=Nioella aestuarii TaxID=1662864 RepID=UPI003D7F20C7